MFYRIIAAILLSVMAGFASQTRAQEIPTLAYGYCGDISHSIGMIGVDVNYQAGMCIDGETTANYDGCTLTAVMIGTGTEPWSNAKICLSYDLNEAPFYEQDITVETERWNTIDLTTPYKLEAGKTIYIYYKLVAGKSRRERSCPIGSDNGPANPKGDLWGYATKAEDLSWKHLADENYGNICIKAVLEGASLTRYDLTVDNIVTRDFVKPGVPFDAEVSVRNLASETVTSFDIIYQLGDKTPVTNTYKANLANNKTAFFTIKDIVIDSEGEWPLKVTVSNPNGQQDEFTDNDSRTVTLRCSSSLVARKVLVEQFTTARCENCPAGHERLAEGLKGYDRIIYVAHHAGFSTDKFTLPASTTFLSFYGSSGTYAPAVMFDRTCLYDEGATAKNTPVTGIGTPEEVRHLADVRLNEPAAVSLGINYEIADGKIKVTVSGESLINFNDARINVFLTEDGLIYMQAGAPNELEYEHNHVLRSVLTSTWGSAFEVKDGKFSETYSTNIDDTWNLNNMTIVAFVSHMNVSDYCDRAVYNAESMKIATDIDGIREVNISASDKAGSRYSDGSVYLLDGRKAGSVSDAHGIYVINGKKFIK